jgi:5'-nucleotidase
MTNNSRPLILVVNDDGYQAKGLSALVHVAQKFGNVVVVAPDGTRSGMSHAVTFNDPLRLTGITTDDNLTIYKTNGTPVDCVKLGQKVVLKDKKIDLILSGINHGSNSSISVIYSGTVAAALEGSIENFPSIAFSLLNYSEEADFSAAAFYAEKIIEKVLENPLPPHTALNVNIPNVQRSDIKGMKITRQTKAFWHEEFIKRKDPNGKNYYWATGYLINEDTGKDSCEWALKNNYVSIQPLHFDLTAYEHIDKLKFLEK